MQDPKVEQRAGGSPNTRTKPVEVVRTNAFGIPAYWAADDGPSAAGLVFRSGRGMEPLAMGGVTHILQHLVASTLGLETHSPQSLNEIDIVDFSYRGSAERVEATLISASRLLSSLPLDDLDITRGVVHEEAAGRRLGAREQLLSLRHGAVGPGAVSFLEYGIRKAGHVQITDWARRHFNRGNAALWIAGPMLENLQLRLVGGAGTHSSFEPLAVPAPGVMYGSAGSVAISFLAPWSHALAAGVHVANRRARTELCDVRGASSTASFALERRNKDLFEVIATADCAPNRDDEVARVLLWIIDCLVTVPPTAAELNAYRNTAASRFMQPDAAADMARAFAVGHLTEHRAQTWPQLLADLDSLDEQEVSLSFANATESMLAIMPRGCPVALERFGYVGGWSPDPVPGARVKPIPVPGETDVDREMLVGPAGVTLREGDRVMSVRFDECSVMLQGDDGYRELIAENGSCVVILAAGWERGDMIVERIDQMIIPEKRLLLDVTSAERRGYTGVERRRRPR